LERNADNSPLGKIAAAIFIISALIAALFWVANVSATASHADTLSVENQKQIETKAEKQDIQRIYDKLDEINKYLRDKR